MTHTERVLELLSDGKPHTHMEGYRLGVMLHSRVADLRKNGHEIDCWREGEFYVYQMVREPERADGDSPFAARVHGPSGDVSSSIGADVSTAGEVLSPHPASPAQLTVWEAA